MNNNMMALNLTLNNIEYNNLQRLTFELLGRAPHLSDNQLTYVKNRIEDLLILVRNEDMNPYPFYYNPDNFPQPTGQPPPEQEQREEDISDSPQPLRLEHDFDTMSFDETLFDDNVNMDIQLSHSSFNTSIESFIDHYHALTGEEEMILEEEVQPPQHSIHHIIKNISNEEIQEFTPDICSICHETHVVSDIFTMECCNQNIGKECLTQWIQTKYVPTCPCCRKTITSYITYCSPCSSNNKCSVLKIDCAENNDEDQWFIDNDEIVE